MMTFSARNSMVPPSGIAWSALMSKLLITWLICPSSASTGQRLSGVRHSHLTFEPLKEKDTDSSTNRAIEIAFVIGLPPLENVSNCRVKSVAREHAFSAASSL